MGSSPPARGPLPPGPNFTKSVWLIPACAGTTASILPTSTTKRAHPRLRGDHITSAMFQAGTGGSSPPARGPPRHSRIKNKIRGLIPACAGTTSSRQCFGRGGRAHPRLRGDHSALPGEIVSTVGSSPPARGPQRNRITRSQPSGLIPACAGTTWEASSLDSHVEAHPRLRGDHSQTLLFSLPVGGSSPPARGPPRGPCSHIQAHRLIPACAGTTISGRHSIVIETAHPRLRGDHFSCVPSTRASSGSSPPARGPLLRFIRKAPTNRLIPACAGTTPGSSMKLAL